MDSIEVAKQLTIGGQKPLDQSAMQQLENKIIAPSQTIYVDAKEGNDNNDGTTLAKAVRTLDKAFTLAHKNCPNVTFYLKTWVEPQYQTYNTFTANTCLDNTALNIENITFLTPFENYRNNGIIAKIVVGYGSIFSGQLDSNNKILYHWGYYLVIRPINITIQTVSLAFPEIEEKQKRKVNRTFFPGLSKTFLFQDNAGAVINLEANTSIVSSVNTTTIESITFGASNSSISAINGEITGTGHIVNSSYGYMSIQDPLLDENAPILSSSSGKVVISKYVNWYTKISGLTNNGLANGVAVIYKELNSNS